MENNSMDNANAYTRVTAQILPEMQGVVAAAVSLPFSVLCVLASQRVKTFTLYTKAVRSSNGREKKCHCLTVLMTMSRNLFYAPRNCMLRSKQCILLETQPFASSTLTDTGMPYSWISGP
jgi:hypothetical protein